MIVLDSSALVRFFTGDDKIKAGQVKDLLTNPSANLYLPDAVVVELSYVLQKKYFLARAEVVRIFNFLAQLRNLKTTTAFTMAAKFFAETKLSITDCFVAAYANNGHEIASFDGELLKTAGMKGFWQ